MNRLASTVGSDPNDNKTQFTSHPTVEKIRKKYAKNSNERSNVYISLSIIYFVSRK